MLICTMALALLVGLAVTSETLYAAVLAQAQEFAVLDALGIPTKHVAGLVLSQRCGWEWGGASGGTTVRGPGPGALRLTPRWSSPPRSLGLPSP